VCPFNNHAPNAAHPELTKDLAPAFVPLVELLKLRSGEYRRFTRDSAIRRAKRNMLRRNAAVAMGNAKQLSDAEKSVLEAAGNDDDPTVRAAAASAVSRRGMNA
jgi:epoxyqueuosine reductase QueG